MAAGKIDFNPSTQRKVHEEQAEREFFLGNFEPPFIERVLKEKWKTLRVGKTAYDEHAAPYPRVMQQSLRPLPVFIERNEALVDHYKLLHG